jgi:hypothetical protein
MTSIRPRLNNTTPVSTTMDIGQPQVPPPQQSYHKSEKEPKKNPVKNDKEGASEPSFYQKNKYIIYTFTIITFLIIVIMYLWMKPTPPKTASPPKKPKAPETKGGGNAKPTSIQQIASSIDPAKLEAMKSLGRKARLQPQPQPQSQSHIKQPESETSDSAIQISEVVDESEDVVVEINDEVDDDPEQTEIDIVYYKLDSDGNVSSEYSGISELQADGYDFKEVAKCCNGEIDKYKGFKFTTTKPN